MVKIVSVSFFFIYAPLRRREANLQKGRQLLREGKVSEARDCFTRCVNITPAMAHNLIKVKSSYLGLLPKVHNVVIDYIVSPAVELKQRRSLSLLQW